MLCRSIFRGPCYQTRLQDGPQRGHSPLPGSRSRLFLRSLADRLTVFCRMIPVCDTRSAFAPPRRVQWEQGFNLRSANTQLQRFNASPAWRAAHEGADAYVTKDGSLERHMRLARSSPYAWGFTYDTAKNAREVALIGKSGGERQFGQRLIGRSGARRVSMRPPTSSSLTTSRGLSDLSSAR